MHAYLIIPSITICASIACIFLGIYYINTNYTLSPIFGVGGFGLFCFGLYLLAICSPPPPISIAKIDQNKITIDIPKQTEIMTQPIEIPKQTEIMIEIPAYSSVFTGHEDKF